MDFLGKAVATAILSCINPIAKNITYPFKVSANVNALDLATEHIKAIQADVKNRVGLAELQGLTQSNQVAQWMVQVDAIKDEVAEIKRKNEERFTSLGRRSLNGCSNYWISKVATKKLKLVQNLCQKGQFEEVAIQLPPRVQEFHVESVVVPKEATDLQKILRYIDNNCDDIIGIWGMGGVGKTRLLHLVHNSYKGSSIFELVFFITATKDCSTEKIQTELFEKYHIGQRGYVESQATKIISNYLCSRSFLLLIDDLWDHIDLQRVGIPYPLGNVNNFKRKIVITTRSSRVCGLMDVKQSHKVTPLDFNDAYHLFAEKVGEETITSHPLMPSLTREIVEELDGLPLALITIGRAMHERKDIREWEDAIDLLQRSRLNEIEQATCDDEKIYYRLKYSYDNLETEELKDCFLACSLWPEDFEIPKEELIECWMGIGILQASNARNIYNHGYTLIGKLLSACLLEHVTSESVKMHDIIRDMALWLACNFGNQRDKWIVQTDGGVNQVLHEKNRWCYTERAALWTHKDVIYVPCEAKKLHFLKVHSTLYNFRGSKVENLKLFSALTFLNLRNCNLEYFPLDILNLVNLRYLNLSCNVITTVPDELKTLEKLMYLYLGYNEIILFPKGIISQLRELRVLSLFLSKCFKTKMEYFTWLIEELECLNNVKSLEIEVQDPADLESLLKLPYLPIRELHIEYFDEIDSLVIPSRFIANRAVQDNLCRLYIRGRLAQKLVIESESYSKNTPCCQLRNLEFLDIEEMLKLEEIIWSRVKPKDLFVKLHTITIGGCNKLNDVSWLVYLPCLEVLVMRWCQSMIKVIGQPDFATTSETREEMVTPTFPSLKAFILGELFNLQVICDPSITFPSLTHLTVLECPMLRKLPFRLDTIPGNLIGIHASEESWEQMEWEDDDHRRALQPFYMADC